MGLARRAAITGEDRRAIAVWVLVDQAHGIVISVHAHHAQHGPENLIAVALHGRRDAIEQRRAQEEAAGLTGRIVAAIDGDRRAFGLGTGQIRGHAVAMLPGYQRPHLVTRFKSRTDFDFRHSLLDG
jgi:hypothetical protein